MAQKISQQKKVKVEAQKISQQKKVKVEAQKISQQKKVKVEAQKKIPQQAAFPLSSPESLYKSPIVGRDEGPKFLSTCEFCGNNIQHNMVQSKQTKQRHLSTKRSARSTSCSDTADQ